VAKKRLTKRIAAAFAGLAAALSGAALAATTVRAPDSPGAGVLKVRFGGDRAQTRIVIDLDRPTTGAEVSFPAPGRLIAPLPKIAAPPEGFDGAGQGLVRRWLVDRAGGQTRLPPGEGVQHWRYVIDLEAASKLPSRPRSVVATPVSTKPAPAKAAPAMVKISSPSSIKRRRVVVIDAGHGGKDPGALGSRSHEKDVTLAAARALKKRLEASGDYRVVLTRDSDLFVPLEARVQIARKADADLFISLHADSGPDTATRGASVYTLSEKGADRVAKVLGPQGLLIPASGPGRDQAVSQILLDLTQRSTKNRSAAFAETLLTHVGDQTVLLRRSHRDAGFVVLLAPEVPAVLLEMGFITSPEDERMLTGADSRARLIDAVGDAIDAFFVRPSTTLAD